MPTDPDAPLPPADVPREGWPSRRFIERWPIDPTWQPQPPAKGVGAMGYQKAVSAVQLLMRDPALAPVMAGLRDYCFQQGAETNANARDRAMFDASLAHDLIFMRGDRGHPLVKDLPIEGGGFSAVLPQLLASHLDLYRVTARGLLGKTTLEPLLGAQTPQGSGAPLHTRLLRGPGAGVHLIGRVVQVGRGPALVSPWLEVDEAEAQALRAVFAEELAAARALHPDLTGEAFTKIASYHVYEEVVARRLIASFEAGLGAEQALRPVVIEWKVRHPRELPDIARLDEARVVEADAAGRATMVVASLRAPRVRQPTLREAVVSIEGRTVQLIAFLAPAFAPVRDALDRRVPSTALREARQLDLSATYRALRHLG